MDVSPAAIAPPVSPPPPRYGGLRFSLLAGAVYDALASIGPLFDLHRTAALFGMGEIREGYALRFCGLLMAALGLFHLVAAIEVKRTLRPAAAATVIRFVGGIYVIAVTLFGGGVPKVFLAFGCADLLFGILHFGFLSRGVGRGLLGALVKG
ncbi:MAG: hypothetical protein L0323_07175 [Planctomycetes bacterium]|nr:hypothetical protein [Planctomycetota bacterium]